MKFSILLIALASIITIPFFIASLYAQTLEVNQIAPAVKSQNNRPIQSKNLTAEKILEMVDDNMYSDTKKSVCRMVIINRRGKKRSLKLVNWVQGDTKSFSEYLSPAREKGTKMLKIDKNLWTYSPDSDRIIHISGHLLRQSVMGSDLSYEDSNEEVKLSKDYYSKIIEETVYEKQNVWILELTAKKESSAYQSRKVWIDKEKLLPLREERYAKSKRLLKVTKIMEIKKFENRWYPTKMLYKDVLKSGKGTLFIIDDLIFNPEISDEIFSKRSLRR